MGTEIAFPVMDEMEDCETCEPAEPWSQPNKGFLLVINRLTGFRVRVCGSCLEAGISRVVYSQQPSDGFRAAVGAVGTVQR